MIKNNIVILSKEAILSADDLVKELVEVPEWGGAVYVRALTGAERDAFEQSMVEMRTVRQGRKQETVREMRLQNIRARLCALTICDEEGNRLFTDADVQALGRKSASALNRVFQVAQRLSGLTDEDVEELAGNSDEIRSDDSSSA